MFRVANRCFTKKKPSQKIDFKEQRIKKAGVVELVDTQVLGTCDASRGGSSPLARTNAKKMIVIHHLSEWNIHASH